MENLKALLYGIELTPYQKSLAIAEFQLMETTYLKNKPSSLDNRAVKCCCNNPNCATGLNFDTLSNGNICILLTDRNGNEHPMHTNAETIKQIAEHLNIITQ